MEFLIKNQFNLQNNNMIVIKIMEIIQLAIKIKKVFFHKINFLFIIY